MTPPQLTSLDLWGEYERLCTQLLRDALASLADHSAQADELKLNRALYGELNRVMFAASTEGAHLPALVNEPRNPPDPAASTRVASELKFPDVAWVYNDPYADEQGFAKRFVVECKRLTQPPGDYARRYVREGIARFVNVEHSYGGGMASGVMVGYLQEVTLDDALARVNGVAAQDGIPPLDVTDRAGEVSAEFEHDVGRPFPVSPFRLIHLWARVGTWPNA